MTNLDDIKAKLETIELLPKQKKFLANLLYNDDAKFLWYVGGFGCISGDTKLYDHELGIELTAEEWAKSKKPLSVFSYDRETKTVCIKKGSRIYKKGLQQMYRVKLANDKHIDVIKAHAFLTADGSWKQLNQINVGDDILSVQNYWGISSDLKDRCSEDLNRYGEQLRQSARDALASVQQPKYVQKHRCDVARANDGVKDDTQERISPYQLAFNLSNLYVSNLTSNLREALSNPNGEYIFAQSSVSLQKTLLSLKNSTLHPSYYELARNLIDDPSCFDSFFMDFLIVSLTNLRLLSDDNKNDQLFQIASTLLYNVAQQQVNLHQFGQSSSALYTINDKNIIINLPNECVYTKVIEIIKLKKEHYYDIEIPDTMSYFANGILNHNSGKSFIGNMGGIILSYMYPKNLGIISRSTLVDLKNTTQRTFFEICEMFGLQEGVHYSFDRHEQRLKFDNGSEIIFTGLDDIAKIKGMEPGRFYIDEVDEVDQEVFKVFQRRLRNKYTDRRVGFITSNSEGKNRTYQIFIRGEGVPENYRDKYYSFRASSLENRFLPKDYIDNLLSFDTDYFKRYVLGEFNVFEGQIFDEFTEVVHIVDDFEAPEGRDIAYGLDHGLSNPTAIVEGRISHDGDLYITREHYLAGKAVSYHADTLKERRTKLSLPLTGQPNVVADPSIFAKSQLPTQERPFPWSVADEYSERGVSCIRGNNEVLAGINRIKELLKLNKIYIFRSCVDLIKEVQKYRREKGREGVAKKEAPIKKDDHLCLVGNTLITTPGGTKKLKDIQEGEFVLTPLGYKKIIRKKMTGVKQVMSLSIGDKEIIGTPDHKIWTPSGYKQLASITEMDTLSYALNPNSEECLCQTLFKDPKQFILWAEHTIIDEDIMTHHDDTQNEEKDYIKLYEKAYMGGKLKNDMLSITKIETLITTMYSTFMKWSQHYINLNMLKKDSKMKNIKQNKLNILQRLEIGLKYDIDHMNEDNDILSMVKKLGKISNDIIKYVECAEKIIQHRSQQDPNDVDQTVSKKLLQKEEAVYSIEIEDVHCFYANDILVKNCDAMRYMIMMKLGPAKRQLKGGYMTISEIVNDDIARYKEPNKYKDEEYVP